MTLYFRRTAIAILMGAILGMLGCSESHKSYSFCEFEFANISGELICVSGLSNLEHEPPFRFLSPGDLAGVAQDSVQLPAQKLPNEMTLTWSVVKNPVDEVDVDKLPVTKTEFIIPMSARNDRTFHLIFEYAGGGKWTLKDGKGR